MKAAVAAGHPATVDAGIEILEEGGSAADAAVAATLASCVAETVMTGLLGGARIYSPRGELLAAGDKLEQPGLTDALEALALDTSAVYGGSIGESLLALSAERGGLLTRTDLDAYEPRWSEPVEVGYRAARLVTRGGLSGLP